MSRWRRNRKRDVDTDRRQLRASWTRTRATAALLLLVLVTTAAVAGSREGAGSAATGSLDARDVAAAFADAGFTNQVVRASFGGTDGVTVRLEIPRSDKGIAQRAAQYRRSPAGAPDVRVACNALAVVTPSRPALATEGLSATAQRTPRGAARTGRPKAAARRSPAGAETVSALWSDIVARCGASSSGMVSVADVIAAVQDAGADAVEVASDRTTRESGVLVVATVFEDERDATKFAKAVAKGDADAPAPAVRVCSTVVTTAAFGAEDVAERLQRYHRGLDRLRAACD